MAQEHEDGAAAPRALDVVDAIVELQTRVLLVVFVVVGVARSVAERLVRPERAQRDERVRGHDTERSLEVLDPLARGVDLVPHDAHALRLEFVLGADDAARVDAEEDAEREDHNTREDEGGDRDASAELSELAPRPPRPRALGLFRNAAVLLADLAVRAGPDFVAEDEAAVEQDAVPAAPRPHDVRVAAAAAPSPKEYPRRDLSPRNIHVAAAAVPRLVPRNVHVAAAAMPSPRNVHVAAAATSRLHGMSTSQPRRRRELIYAPAART